MSQNPQPIRCPKCGAELPSHLPASQCPKCLLAAGLETQPQTGPEDTVVTPPSPALKGIPQPGEIFGHYRLVRLLGQGGMGVVFEADDLETGRRVALKILSQALDSPESRKRFLREGQIAASINHPNSVYVFGTEEIAGTPVIAMELVAGGTLRDRVVASGPLPATEAVDVILQIIAGLEAAQLAGVLHRDIKPSNCFVDADGTVKIGDFGLSITTTVRTESNLTGAGSLFGTPAFSSPEQLRGEELTVRSDIYSVGVTLYYLLTGRMPFEAPNMVQLLVTVLEKRPTSPTQLRASIPKGLARAVLHCLNKAPEARFAHYAALRRALLPYASSSPSPATLPLRFAAWIVDHIILTIPNLALVFLIYRDFTAMSRPGHDLKTIFYYLVSFLLVVGYFGLFEGLRGASPGKMLCRLRVVGLDGSLPGFGKACLRALIFWGFAALPSLVVLWFSQTWLTQQPANPKFSLILFVPAALQLLIFCSCRRRNGFAGLHDLWSRTRVLVNADQATRPCTPLAPETPPNTAELSKIGPYHVLADLGQSDQATVLLGYDTRLLRKVWLRRVLPTAPAVGAVQRHLARLGRLRWLNGKRADDEAWDAYEAPAGQPLLNLMTAPQDWGKVRFWLLDLAEELKAADKDGSLPPALNLDRLWITADGRAKLLDFPAPGITTPNPVEPAAPVSSVEFLQQAALSALKGQPLSAAQARAGALDLLLPLYARNFFQQLKTAPDVRQIGRLLKPLTGKPAIITRARRWAMLAIALALPLFIVATQMLATHYISSLHSMDFAALKISLAQVKRAEQIGQQPQLETYIAGRFAPLITNAVNWNGASAQIFIQPDQRTLAERIVATHPKVSPDEFAAAKTVAETQLHVPPASTNYPNVSQGIYRMLPLITYVGMLMLVVIPCLVAALLFRGGLAMRLLGMAVVGRNGRPSRLRTLWRNFIAWLPFLLSPMLVKAVEHIVGIEWSVPVAVGILALVTVFSLSLRRSLQDRLAGAWLVPGGNTTEVEPIADGQSKARFPWLPVAGVAGLLALILLLAPVVRHLIPDQKSSSVAFVPAMPCVALLPDGTPAAAATVWVGTEKSPTLNCFQPNNYYPFGMQKIQSDAASRFTLPASADDAMVIVTHPAGLLQTTAAAVRQTGRAQLQPFGRVEGVLLSEGKPKSGANVSIQRFHEQRGLDMTYSAVSGGDGRFTFTNLMAGEYNLYRSFFPRRQPDGGFAVHPSHQKNIAVTSGETVTVQWGGGGRTVIGQAMPENPALKVDWLNDSQSLELVHPSATASVAKFVRDSWGLGKSAAEQLQAAHEARSYHLEFEEDGSFRAEDVPPGNYELRIRVTKPMPPGADPIRREGDLLGSLVQAVTIPAGQEPFDLGTQIMSVKGEPAAAPALPLNANLTTPDGQSLSLASLRGKFVVLVFGASWSEPGRKTLANLQPVRDEFATDSRVVFITANLDDDSTDGTQSAAMEGFIRTRLAISERAAVADNFEITTLPAVFLLSPDGRIYARDLAPERLRATLQRVLPATGQSGKPNRLAITNLASLKRLEASAALTNLSVAGIVIGDDGRTIAGATIQAQGVSTSNGSQQWGGAGRFVDDKVVSDAQGHFQIQCKTNVELIYAMASSPAAAPRPIQLQPGRDYLVRLHTGVTVTGRLTSANLPVPGAAIRVLPAHRANGEYFTSDKITTDNNGRFSVPHLPPEMGLTLVGTMASLQGKGALSPQSFTSGKNQTTTDLGDLKLKPGYRVAGQIVLTDGQPIPPRTRLLLVRQGAADYADVTLPADGRFEFQSVPAESVSLSLRLKAYKFSHRNPSVDWLNDQILGQVQGDITNLTLIVEPGEFRYSSNHEDAPEGTDLQPRDKPLRGAAPNPSGVLN